MSAVPVRPEFSTPTDRTSVSPTAKTGLFTPVEAEGGPNRAVLKFDTVSPVWLSVRELSEVKAVPIARPPDVNKGLENDTIRGQEIRAAVHWSGYAMIVRNFPTRSTYPWL